MTLVDQTPYSCASGRRMLTSENFDRASYSGRNTNYGFVVCRKLGPG
jgi:hypothetical protein